MSKQRSAVAVQIAFVLLILLAGLVGGSPPVQRSSGAGIAAGTPAMARPAGILGSASDETPGQDGVAH